jgi:hypothetical protein
MVRPPADAGSILVDSGLTSRGPMKQRLVRASHTWLAWVCSSLVFGLSGFGCLPDDPAVKGQLLYPGSNIESPVFLAIDQGQGAGKEPWVMFQTRRTRATRFQGGTSDLHLVKWPDGAQHRVIIEGRSDRGEWPAVRDASGAYFYMTNERLAQNGLPVGTLNRISLTDGLKETVPDVMSYALGETRNTFYYRKYVPGSPYPELHLRDLTGQDRNLGILSGQVVLLGDDLFYYVAGATQTLTRVQGFVAPALPLRTRVTRFQLGAAEKFALATVSDDGVLHTLVLDFVNKTERPLPVATPCCWLDLRGSNFLFADSAKGGKPAELHYFDVNTGADRVVQMPPGLADVVAIVARPPAGKDALIFDSTRRVAIYRPGETPEVELTNLRPSAPAFSPDGKYLLYLLPDPPPPPPAVTSLVTGQLFAQDAENWQLPPRKLSPEGASVPIEPQKGYLVREGRPYPLVFWARYGLGASDLYLGDHETGDRVRVAQGIGEVSVSQTHVLGVINMSQDLTGDLVFRDFGAAKERIVEHGVSEVEFDGLLFPGDLIAFVVHERMPSSRRNGLWSTELAPIEEAPAEGMLIRSPGFFDGVTSLGAEVFVGEGGGGGDVPGTSAPARDR